MWLLRNPADRSIGLPSTSGRTTPQQWSPSGRTRTVRGSYVAAKAAQKGQEQQMSRRNAQLYELSDDDGWGVEVADPAMSSKPASSTAAPVKQQKAATTGVKAGRQRGTPYVDMRSEEGVLGLTLLQKALLIEEEQQAQGQAEAEGPASQAADVAAVKQNLQQSTKGARRPKLPGFPTGSAAAAAAAVAALKQRQEMYDDEDEEGEYDDSAKPEFQITFDNGKTEFTDFSSGTTSSSSTADAEQSPDDFSMSGWGAFDGLEQDQDLEDEDYEQLYTEPARSGKRKAPTPDDDDEDAVEASLIADMSNEDDWGLESLMNPATANRKGRRSLLDELSYQEAAADGFQEGSLAAENSGSVQWGGSAGTTGIDLEEQEELLRRYFRPDQVKKLMKDQIEIDASYSEMRKRAVGLGVNDKKMHEKLRIVSGTAAGKKLISFRSNQTRPMMEKVRQAIFNIIQSQAGTVNSLPKTARWLDLFAGTGSVGLEALSRGIREAHFVEMDPIVVQKILSRNIMTCGFKGKATCHTSKAEDFLRRANQLPRFAGGPFDFISVCPPYLLVSYPELYDLLEQSPLIHPGSIVFVEYPKQLSQHVRDSIGPLQKVKDRKYGRTYVAVYAAGDVAAEQEVDDPFLSGNF